MIWLKSGNQEIFDKKVLLENNKKILVSESLVMKTLLKEIDKISKLSAPVLILGESGVGKKMIACEIFYNTLINNQNLIAFNCSGMDETLVDIKLFGSATEVGCLSDISKKTILLEFVDSLSLKLQDKLIKFFRNYNKIPYDFRIICTANSSLPVRIEHGLFREELFSHLSQNLLIVPSLVERQEDIPALIKDFLKENNFKGSLTNQAMERLKSHAWKGNVLELKNICIKIATLYPNQVVDMEQLPITFHSNLDVSLFVKYNKNIQLKDLINYYITEALKRFKSKKESARSLGISAKTIYNKLEKGEIKV